MRQIIKHHTKFPFSIDNKKKNGFLSNTRELCGFLCEISLRVIFDTFYNYYSLSIDVPTKKTHIILSAIDALLRVNGSPDYSIYHLQRFTSFVVNKYLFFYLKNIVL